mgnify:CR=1 FL=1
MLQNFVTNSSFAKFSKLQNFYETWNGINYSNQYDNMVVDIVKKKRNQGLRRTQIEKKELFD